MALSAFKIDHEKIKETPAQYYARALNEISTLYGFTLANLAPKIGVSESVISQVRKETYPYAPENPAWKLIAEFVSSITANIYQTELLNTVFQLLDTTFDERELSVITSCSGAGKTTAVERYCLVKPHTVHIRVVEVMTIKSLLQDIAKALGCPHTGMNSQSLFEMLSEVLKRKPRLIVIDEAERLKVAMLEMLRDIFDQGNIGLCLIGLGELRSLLVRGKNQKENLVQLYSRIGFNEVVDILTPKDVTLILRDKLPGHQVSNSKIKDLANSYRKKGGLRAVIKLCNLLNHADNLPVVNDEAIAAAESELAL